MVPVEERELSTPGLLTALQRTYVRVAAHSDECAPSVLAINMLVVLSPTWPTGSTTACERPHLVSVCAFASGVLFVADNSPEGAILGVRIGVRCKACRRRKRRGVNATLAVPNTGQPSPDDLTGRNSYSNGRPPGALTCLRAIYYVRTPSPPWNGVYILVPLNVD